MQIIEIIFLRFLWTVYKNKWDERYRDTDDRTIGRKRWKTLGFHVSTPHRHPHHRHHCHPHHLCHLHPLHGDVSPVDWPVADDAPPTLSPSGRHGPQGKGPVWKISSASDKMGNAKLPVKIQKCGSVEINMERSQNSTVLLQPCPPEHGPSAASQGWSWVDWANCAALSLL